MTEAAWQAALDEELRIHNELMIALYERERDPSEIRRRTAALTWKRWEEAQERTTAALLAWKNPTKE